MVAVMDTNEYTLSFSVSEDQYDVLSDWTVDHQVSLSEGIDQAFALYWRDSLHRRWPVGIRQGRQGLQREKEGRARGNLLVHVVLMNAAQNDEIEEFLREHDNPYGGRSALVELVLDHFF